MKPKVMIQRVALKGTPIYTCTACGKFGAGETVRREAITECESPEAVARQVERMIANVANSHMPDGWASYPEDVYKCSFCREKGK